MSLFRHRHRPEIWVDAYTVAKDAPPMSVGGTSAKASLCRCGAILRREITPNGHQQLGWGETHESLMAALDTKIIELLIARGR